MILPFDLPFLAVNATTLLRIPATWLGLFMKGALSYEPTAKSTKLPALPKFLFDIMIKALLSITYVLKLASAETESNGYTT
ncbi:hypothetical protein Dimus_002514 [Dionaea muscipula]